MVFLFEDLEVYKRSMKLVIKAYAFCGGREVNGNRKLIDQLQRAVLSIPLNIAEGQGRAHSREKKQYYNTAKGSLYECLPIIQICCELKYIGDEEYQEIYSLMNEIAKMLAGLIKSVQENNK